MNEMFKDVAQQMTEFYSQTGKKLMSRASILSKVLTEKRTEEYIKPPTPLYFKVYHY